MKPEDFIKVFAGTIVLVTSLLGYLHSKYWLFATMFVGLNLMQFAFTGFCPADKVYRKLCPKC